MPDPRKIGIMKTAVRLVCWSAVAIDTLMLNKVGVERLEAEFFHAAF